MDGPLWRVQITKVNRSHDGCVGVRERRVQLDVTDVRNPGGVLAWVRRELCRSRGQPGGEIICWRTTKGISKLRLALAISPRLHDAEEQVRLPKLLPPVSNESRQRAGVIRSTPLAYVVFALLIIQIKHAVTVELIT